MTGKPTPRVRGVRWRKGLCTGPFGRMTFALWLLTAGLRLAVLIVRISWVFVVPVMASLVIIWVPTLLHDAG